MSRSTRISTVSVTNSIVILLLIVAVGVYIVHAERANVRVEGSTFRQQWYASQKELLASTVRTASEYVAYRSRKETQGAERDLRAHTTELIGIANRAYAQQHRGTPGGTIRDRIVELLRSLPTNSDNGAAIVLTRGAINLLLPTSRSGQPRHRLSSGLYKEIVDRFRAADSKSLRPISLVIKTSSGSYLVSVSRFDHFGWLIGSVMNRSLVRQRVQEDALPWIQRIRFGDDGRLFVFTAPAVHTVPSGLSSHARTDITPTTGPFSDEGPKTRRVFRELLQRAQLPGGGYLSFHTGRSAEHKSPAWLAYADVVPATGWVIGGVVDSSVNEACFAPFIGQAESHSRQVFFSLLGLAVVSAILSIALNRLFHRKISGTLELFQMAFRRSALTQRGMDPNQFAFVEFRELAEYADRIVSDRRVADERSRLAEEQLQQAQKMEAVGRLAGGIAHDFNNLLTVIVGYAEMTLMVPEIDSSSRRALEEIYASAQSAASLTQQLLTFSRRRKLRSIVFNLDTVVQDLETLLHSLLGHNIRTIVQLDPSGAYMKADPHEIERVVLNLVLNARDAMPTGGQLYLTVRNLIVSDEEAEERQLTPLGNYVVLEVRDTGIGIDPGDLSRIFEPFYTTKEKGKGTGLGLSAVFGIVQQSGGRVHVESELTRGTTFTVYFPRMESESVGGGESTVNAVPINFPATVLVIEHDEKVRTMIVSALQRSGLTTFDVGDGAAALDISNTRDGNDVDVILIDAVLPDMKSAELIKRLQVRLRNAKVLFMSAYGDESVPKEASFLLKPFTPESLLAKIVEMDVHPAVASRSVDQTAKPTWYTIVKP